MHIYGNVNGDKFTCILHPSYLQSYFKMPALVSFFKKGDFGGNVMVGTQHDFMLPYFLCSLKYQSVENFVLVI